MSARFLRTKQRGQSIPLIALLIVVLVGAALAVLWLKGRRLPR